MKTIEIIVSPTGEAIVQTKGFSGASCREASKLIEQALGERVAETLTPEFHQDHLAQQQQATTSS